VNFLLTSFWISSAGLAAECGEVDGEIEIYCNEAPAYTCRIYVKNGNFFFDGCNIHVQNGSNDTINENSLGNVVLGYDEDNGSDLSNRTGSHNFVIGRHHTYTSVANIVTGEDNSSGGFESGVFGGTRNVISSGLAISLMVWSSVIVGGEQNKIESGSALGESVGDSVIIGGRENSISPDGTTLNIYRVAILGGRSNIITALSGYEGNNGVIVGGQHNTVDEPHGQVFGGSDNVGKNRVAILGGQSNGGVGNYSTVTGGQSNTIFSEYSTIAGGFGNVVDSSPHMTSHSAVSGGLNNTARGTFSVVSGGNNNEARGTASVVSAGLSNVTGLSGTTTGINSVVSGGVSNNASGQYAVVSGGSSHHAANGVSTVSGIGHTPLTTSVNGEHIP